jgi:uncharacterized membrane protein HdeD (DUF308 family)
VQLTKQDRKMANVVSWALFALGVAHIAFGLVRFRTALTEACVAGFVGQFQAPEARRTAFWFLMCGPLLMVTGQVAVHAVAISDFWLLRVIGAYLLVVSAIGVTAFPKSPLWAPLLLSPLFILAGYGLLG